MKKIKMQFNQKDRVIIRNVHDGHEFYYQPVDSKISMYLFRIDNFSGSISEYFRNRGRSLGNGSYSMTIKELYTFKKFDNPKLTNTIKRIPMMIDYVLTEALEDEKYNLIVSKSHESKWFGYDDFKFIA